MAFLPKFTTSGMHAVHKLLATVGLQAAFPFLNPIQENAIVKLCCTCNVFGMSELAAHGEKCWPLRSGSWLGHAVPLVLAEITQHFIRLLAHDEQIVRS